jgi:predicted RNase H-like HicB family nuclease
MYIYHLLMVLLHQTPPVVNLDVCLFDPEYRIEDGWYVGKLPEVPGVFSQGQTLEELEEKIRDAYDLVIGVIWGICSSDNQALTEPGREENPLVLCVLADLAVSRPVSSIDSLVLPAHPSPQTVFASRKVAVSGERTPRFEFDPDKQRISDYKENATRSSAALFFRFAGKLRGSLESGRVLVPPPREKPTQGQVCAPRSTVSPL